MTCLGYHMFHFWLCSIWFFIWKVELKTNTRFVYCVQRQDWKRALRETPMKCSKSYRHTMAQNLPKTSKWIIFASNLQKFMKFRMNNIRVFSYIWTMIFLRFFFIFFWKKNEFFFPKFKKNNKVLKLPQRENITSK